MYCKLTARAVARSLVVLTWCLFLGFAPAYASKRVALVVGNSVYAHLAQLSNPHLDARALAELLKSHGWEVIEGLNLSFVQLHDAVADFEEKARGADVALVYYAGHGMSYQNRDFIAPTDMPEHCASDALKRVFPLDRFFQAVDGAQRKIVLLDACRNQPFPNCAKRGNEGGFRGLARVQSSGLLIASATAPGAVAEDGAPGAHSPFARVLLNHFRTHPNVYLHELLFKVAADVDRASKQNQTPELVIRGVVPQFCLSAEGCGPLASAPEDVIRMRKETEATRRKAIEEAEQLRRRSKEEAETADRQKRQAEDEASRKRQEAEAADRRLREAEEKAARMRREADVAEQRRRDAEDRAAAIRRESEDAEHRRRREVEEAQRAIPPPPPSCGWYAIAYCSQDSWVAQARTSIYGGFVINTGDYAKFRAGWFCVVQGPMARDVATAVMQRMRAAGASTAYIKSSC